MPYSFINPYNFIPLGKAPGEKQWEQPEQSDQARNFTGKIEYTLTTLSPLFIPNTSNDRVFSASNVLMKDSTPDDPKYHKSFEFFSYRNLAGEQNRDQIPEADYQPVIPGSEIRGAIRSTYEALTDSCLSAIDLDAVLTKRTPERFIPGILKRENSGENGNSGETKWVLYNAVDYLYRENKREDFSVKTFKSVKTSDGRNISDGTKVDFVRDIDAAPRRPPYAKPLAANVRPHNPAGQRTRMSLTGYLVKGEAGPELGKPSRNPKCNECPAKTRERCDREDNKDCYFIEKHCAHIFVEKRETAERFGREQQKVYSKQIGDVLRLYKNNGVSPYKEYAEAWKRFLTNDSDGIPVYYSRISYGSEELFFFSPACITREVYINTLRKIVGNYIPCGKHSNHVCPACNLFGTINDGLHITSRVRFSDLTVSGSSAPQGRLFMDVTALPELSTPKISATEFYLKKPDADNVMNWTYDYYITMGGDHKPKVVTCAPVISGRKFYWHSKKASRVVFANQNSIEITERNKTVRPVADHVRFKGTIYFDGITEKELQQLIGIMNISMFGEENRYAIKLGAAKPLGFGSVALKVDSVSIRTLKKEEQTILYRPNTPYDFGAYDLSQFERGDVIKAFDMQAVDPAEGGGNQQRDPASVSYPGTSADGDVFEWFVSNRHAGRYDRRTGTVDLNGNDAGPGLRGQIAYRQYMKALEPQLCDNPVMPGRRGGAQNRGTEPPRQAQRRSAPRPADRQERRVYETGDTLQGEVTGYAANNNGAYVYAWVQADHQRFKIHISNVEPRPGKNADIRTLLPEGASVKLRKKSVNQYGDVWACSLK